MTGRRAFVTGGTGFIGRNLLRHLADEGWEVTALRRADSRIGDLAELPVAFVEGDVLDLASLEAAIPSGTDVVFHVAADTSLWFRRNPEQTRVNVEGTANLVEAALKRGAGKLVHTSTWNVYGLWNDVISEDRPREGRGSPVNYDRTKTLAEDEVRRGIDRGLPAVIVNPAHVIGPHDRKNWARMIVMTYEGTIPGVPPGSGVFCDALAVAEAHVAAAEKGREGENYLLGGAEATFLEVFEQIGELLDREVPSRPVPAWLFRLIAVASDLGSLLTGREPEVTREVASMVTTHPRIVSDRAERELGYRHVSLRGMLTTCIRWLEEEGVIGSSAAVRPRTRSRQGGGEGR